MVGVLKMDGDRRSLGEWRILCSKREGAGDFSESLDSDIGRPGGRTILYGYILGIWQWRERRSRSGFPPWAYIRELNREVGERHKV